jgi:hypothetical protein
MPSIGDWVTPAAAPGRVVRLGPLLSLRLLSLLIDLLPARWSEPVLIQEYHRRPGTVTDEASASLRRDVALNRETDDVPSPPSGTMAGFIGRPPGASAWHSLLVGAGARPRELIGLPGPSGARPPVGADRVVASYSQAPRPDAILFRLAQRGTSAAIGADATAPSKWMSV